ncbi:MAG: ferredoxin [Desulfobaccales bacterium]
MAQKKPVINTDACIACGNCEALCPAVFHLNENLGYSEVIEPYAGPVACIQDAIDQCPAQCISWEEREA